MGETIGSRVAKLRKEKELTQEELAGKLGVSGQAVSKWENDVTCPDISMLPQLAAILGITVDELLCGKKEIAPVVQLVPEDQRKNINDMMLRIIVECANGDKVKANLPMALIQAALDKDMGMVQISGNDAFMQIDWKHIMNMVSRGAIGNLVEVESSDGTTVHIFVE